MQAAVEVARALPVPFVLTARAENLLHGRLDLDDTIRRLQAFEKAGADVLYAPGRAGPRHHPDRGLVGEQAGQRGDERGRPGLTRGPARRGVGVKRISVGGALSRLALAAFLKGAREMKERGGFTWMRDTVPAKS